MSLYAHRTALADGLLADPPEQPRKKAWFQADLIELVRPDAFWPQPFSIEQAFEIFRWMVTTGDGYTDQTRWGRVGVKALLSATSANDGREVSAIRSLEDLRTRFHYALLGTARSPSMAQWRKDHRIAPGERVRIPARVHTPFEGAGYLGFASERAVKDTLARLTTESRGQTLRARLNHVHLDVETVHHVHIGVYPQGFVFTLTYGEPCDGRLGSAWSETLARTRPGETFLETLARARDVFDMLLGGTKPCDAADFLGENRYGPTWYRAYLAAYVAGDRAMPLPEVAFYTPLTTQVWMAQQRAAQAGGGALQ